MTSTAFFSLVQTFNHRAKIGLPKRIIPWGWKKLFQSCCLIPGRDEVGYVGKFWELWVILWKITSQKWRDSSWDRIFRLTVKKIDLPIYTSFCSCMTGFFGKTLNHHSEWTLFGIYWWNLFWDAKVLIHQCTSMYWIFWEHFPHLPSFERLQYIRNPTPGKTTRGAPKRLKISQHPYSMYFDVGKWSYFANLENPWKNPERKCRKSDIKHSVGSTSITWKNIMTIMNDAKISHLRQH